MSEKVSLDYTRTYLVEIVFKTLINYKIKICAKIFLNKILWEL